MNKYRLCLTQFTLIILFALIQGCASHKDMHEAAICKYTCREKFKLCQKACQNNIPRCIACENKQALRSYLHYKKQQCVQGKPVIRELQSYRDPLQCRKTTCDCNTDYRVCAQACTGLIHKRLQVPPTCDS